MTYDEKYQMMQSIHKRLREYRGSVLATVSVIEADMGDLIDEYFALQNPARQALFFESFIAGLSASKRREILVEISRAEFPTRHDAEFKGLFTDLKSLLEFRNKLAHGVVRVLETYSPSPPVELITRKGIFVLDDAVFQEIQVTSSMVTTFLEDFGAMVRGHFKKRS